MQIDGQYRKFARLLLGFENLLVAGWREQAEVLLTRTFQQPLLCEPPGSTKYEPLSPLQVSLCWPMDCLLSVGCSEMMH